MIEENIDNLVNDFNIEYRDKKIWIITKKDYNNINISVSVNGNEIMSSYHHFDKNTFYWFEPDNKLFLDLPFILQISCENLKIQKKFNEEIPLKLNKIKPNLGIGDLLLCYSYIMQHYEEYDKFFILLDYNIITLFRNDSNSIKEFTKRLTNKIFSDPKIEIIEYDPYQNYDDYVPHDLLDNIISNQNIFRLVNMSHLIKNIEIKKYDKPYFILNTKIRLENYNFYLSFKDEFLKIINELSKSYKLILMGERQMEINREYSADPPGLGAFLIYDDILNNIDKNNIIDLTRNELLHQNDINDFLKDCYLINKSSFSILLGRSGVSFIVSSFSDNVIGFRTYDTCDIIKNNFISSKLIDDNGYFLTNDINKFFDKLRELVN